MGFLQMLFFAIAISVAIIAIVSLIAMAALSSMTNGGNAAWHEHQRSRRFFNRW